MFLPRVRFHTLPDRNEDAFARCGDRSRSEGIDDVLVTLPLSSLFLCHAGCEKEMKRKKTDHILLIIDSIHHASES